MLDAPAKTAYRSAIQFEILDVLERAARMYAEQGDPNSDLRDAPEYMINVNLAQGLVSAFPTLRFRLEHPAAMYENSARQAVDARIAIGKDTARFDLVLLNKQTGIPRYIIEVKRGTKIISDARRIISMAALDSGRKRWRHGYLVTILRRSETEVVRIVKELADEIEAIRSTKSAELPNHQQVIVKCIHKRIGDSRQEAKSKAIYGLVFQVSLVDRTVTEAAEEAEFDA
ncbi:hypothetical protein LJR069_004432 [Variovorax paradoxus]|uniref:hypothetical protein n=1 Tax=Variovorax paradoxus TaxID=34073 RepID=UPI003ED173D7